MAHPALHPPEFSGAAGSQYSHHLDHELNVHQFPGTNDSSRQVVQCGCRSLNQSIFREIDIGPIRYICFHVAPFLCSNAEDMLFKNNVLP